MASGSNELDLVWIWLNEKFMIAKLLTCKYEISQLASYYQPCSYCCMMCMFGLNQ